MIEKDGQFGNKQTISRQNFKKYLIHVSEYVDRIYEVHRDENGNEITKGATYKDYFIADINEKGALAKEYYSSVSYYNGPAGTEEVYTSFATKLAEVYTSFKIGDEYVRNIQFLDTPGIGENKVGIEKTLSDAVTMKLDIVLVVKAAGNSKSDTDTEKFNELIRERLTGKDTASTWVYYILNVWKDKIKKGDIKKLRDSIQSGLKEAQSSDKIVLADNHFRYMDLKNGAALSIDGDVLEYQNPVNEYLSDILNSLIGQIRAIDEEFFTLGEKAYVGIIQEWKELHQTIKTIKKYLPSLEPHFLAEDLIKKLSPALTEVANWSTLIAETVKPDLKPFKEDTIGNYVAKVLHSDRGDITFDNPSTQAKDIELFYDKNKLNIEKYGCFRQSYFRDNSNFIEYSSVKRELRNALIGGILALIKDKPAQKKLVQYKSDLQGVLCDKGGFSFIISNTENWWADVADFLGDEPNCTSLEELFRAVSTLNIDLQDKLKDTIETSMGNSLHHDDFGDPDEYNFEDYPSSVCSFIHSLLNIEQFAKGVVEKGIIDEALDKIQYSISLRLDNIVSMCGTATNVTNSKTRDELSAFYQRHLDDIFQDNDNAKKMAVVKRWDDLIKVKI